MGHEEPQLHRDSAVPVYRKELAGAEGSKQSAKLLPHFRFALFNTHFPIGRRTPSHQSIRSLPPSSGLMTSPARAVQKKLRHTFPTTPVWLRTNSRLSARKSKGVIRRLAEKERRRLQQRGDDGELRPAKCWMCANEDEGVEPGSSSPASTIHSLGKRSGMRHRVLLVDAAHARVFRVQASYECSNSKLFGNPTSAATTKS